MCRTGSIRSRTAWRFLQRVDETAIATSRKQELLNLESMFCHDRVIATVLHLQQWLGPHVLQVEYIWMTRLLPLVRADVLKVLDTIDVFSSIDRKVRRFGVRDVTVDPREEAERLRRGDLIVAIQDEEHQELQRLAPGIPIVTAGVDFDVVADAAGVDRRADPVHRVGQSPKLQGTDRLRPTGLATDPSQRA